MGVWVVLAQKGELPVLFLYFSFLMVPKLDHWQYYITEVSHLSFLTGHTLIKFSSII